MNEDFEISDGQPISNKRLQPTLDRKRLPIGQARKIRRRPTQIIFTIIDPHVVGIPIF